jgi:hypothetical protein
MSFTIWLKRIFFRPAALLIFSFGMVDSFPDRLLELLHLRRGQRGVVGSVLHRHQHRQLTRDLELDLPPDLDQLMLRARSINRACSAFRVV